MDNVALIDGDSFLYRAGFAVEKTKYLIETPTNELFMWQTFDSVKEYKPFVEEMEKQGHKCIVWSRKELGTLDDAVAILEAMLEDAIKASGMGEHYIYLSPSVGNFRDTLGTLRKYKGNRDNAQRPYYYSDLREYLCTKRMAIVARGEEADDQISWVARKWFKEGRTYCIVGIDKDLKQIPGRHYDWVNKEHFTLTEDEAKILYWAQVLSGDPGDNIGGCWGLGPRKAENFLLGCESFSDEYMWSRVVRKYREGQKLKDCPYRDHDPEVVALENLRLIRLRQEVNESLWTPPQSREEGKEASSRE